MEDEFRNHAPSPSDIENPSTPSNVKSLQQELKSLPPLSSECCIYRVPELLRVVNEEAYTPQVVSIGPLHHGKDERLKPMEEHKKRYLRDYLERTTVGLEEYMKIIKDKEAKLRSCYAEPIAFPSDEFVKIVLVDAAFIIEVLLRNSTFWRPKDVHDPIFDKPWMLKYILPDLQLLENQLPFFILEELYEPERSLVSVNEGEMSSIIKLSHNLFKQLTLFKGTKNNLELFSPPRVSCLHFVDFLRNFYVPFERNPGQRAMETFHIPTIRELLHCGVRLKAGSGKNLLDIHFSQGILEIPELNIEDHTELTIRNLIAFEQCHCPQKYMTAYIVILDKLVNTREDVELLVKHKIVENYLGDCSQVATLINKLGKGVFFSSYFYYGGIFEELCDYSGTSWHKWMANLRQNYFHTPWAIVSVIAAAVLIILTIIQTVCSIISITVKDTSSLGHYLYPKV